MTEAVGRAMTDLPQLVNKTVEFAYRGARLGFDLSHALFSSFSVDAGTRLLLKEIAHDEKITSASRLLDAGCGTGIIGISLAASSPSMNVVMRDRDLLAVAFSERNCWRNGLKAVRLGLDGQPLPPIQGRAPKHKAPPDRSGSITLAPGLLGADDPFGPYDAVLSNLPAKAGAPVLSNFIMKCGRDLLVPGGRLAFVIVATLADAASGWIAASGLKTVHRTATKNHCVFILEKNEGEPNEKAEPVLPGIPEKLPEFYLRTSGKRAVGRCNVRASGYWGLPEFDTLNYRTELAIEAAEKACAGNLVRKALLAEPGIGLAALWAAASLGPLEISILSRDTLSLCASRSNLAEAGYGKTACRVLSPAEDPCLPEADTDFILWFPDEIPQYDFISPAWALFARAAKKGAAIVIVAPSTIAARFLKTIPRGFTPLGEKRRKGFSALMLRRAA